MCWSEWWRAVRGRREQRMKVKRETVIDMWVSKLNPKQTNKQHCNTLFLFPITFKIKYTLITKLNIVKKFIYFLKLIKKLIHYYTLFRLKTLPCPFGTCDDGCENKNDKRK